MPAAPELSVVICAWRPEGALPGAVESLAAQDLPADAFEIIIVDNSPTGTLRATADAAARQVPARVRWVQEPRPGAAWARNGGIAAARGEIIAFLDDDARAEPGWARLLLAAFREVPEADGIGGAIVLEDFEPPAWWRREYDEACGALAYGARRRRIGYPRYPYAGNQAFRRDVFPWVGLFSPELGPVGTRHLDGEEIELCVRLERAGGRLYYDPAVRVFHQVAPGRLSRRFVWHKGFQHGRSMAMIEARHFGRRFALWRSLGRRDLLARRRRAFGTSAGAGGDLEPWLNVLASDAQGLHLKVLAQGLGYASQTFLQESWKPREFVVPRAVNSGDVSTSPSPEPTAK
jgi:glycosyltransferase involved in cell wall biosynthesis